MTSNPATTPSSFARAAQRIRAAKLLPRDILVLDCAIRKPGCSVIDVISETQMGRPYIKHAIGRLGDLDYLRNAQGAKFCLAELHATEAGAAFIGTPL